MLYNYIDFDAVEPQIEVLFPSTPKKTIAEAIERYLWEDPRPDFWADQYANAGLIELEDEDLEIE